MKRREMDRSFVIIQVSDLHLDGSGRLLPTVEALVAAIRNTMAGLSSVPDRILLITGDLVDDPTPRALHEALSVIAAFRQTGLFTDIQAIAGDHDVRRVGLRGGRHDAYDYLHLPRTSKSIYYRRSGLDLVLLDSNAASLARGSIDQDTYHATVARSARLSAGLAGSLGSAGKADYVEPADNLVRILALHHHPLPQATGEGKRFLGVPDEPLMYLASPATFLEAATSLNVDLVLHGHRHVEGLTRYSIPNPRATLGAAGEEFWRTIYVLSCPSSTGQGGDDAGFNLIHFGPSMQARRVQYRFSIVRYSRRRNNDAFDPLDSNLPNGVILLPAGRDFDRDPAFQSAIEIASCEMLKRDQMLALVRRLLGRRAFYGETGQGNFEGWTQALHSYLVTCRVWEELNGKLAKSVRQRDGNALAGVGSVLGLLIVQCADVLGIDRTELDALRSNRLIDHADVMRELPKMPRDGIDLAEQTQQRLRLLRKLNIQASALGVELDLGGEPPAGELP
jgi:3',5'-cyclic AMP phosphodiesterase CpdA